MCKRNCYKNFYNVQRTFLSLLPLCEICLLLTVPLYVICNEVNSVSSFESDLNFSVYNDTYENFTLFNQNISDFGIKNKTINNISDFDVSTELESSISVTEDSDSSFQTETSRKLILFLTPDEDICNCDLSTNVCDINCCCDPDCNEEDMQVFSECSHQVLTPDENYCYQQDIIFRNNTPYRMVKNPKNALFCIVHDNFKHHLRFKDMPILKSHRDLITVLKYKYKTAYSWDVESEKPFETSELRVGNPIYIDVKSNNNAVTSHWSLPSSCLSDMCSCQENLRYLHNFQSICSYVIDDLQNRCQYNDILSADQFTNFCISSRSAPSHAANTLADLIIHTERINSSSNEHDEYYSSQLSRICAPKNPIRPKKTSDICQNVVSHINFTIEQDGTNGITGILVGFKYMNISLDKKVITQGYSVNFVWSNVSEIGRKSGNPGYQLGHPILAATNGSDVDADEMSRTFYKNGLSVLNKDSRSFCSRDRQAIKFGKNLKTGCILKHNFTSCKILQDRIIEILLGPSKKQIFVGAFGNANISDPDDWIEVFHEVNDYPDSDENCFASLGLKIDIVYAAVGTVANPQYKIVGVSYHYTKPEFIDLSCMFSCSNITVRTSVSFLDVTLPAVEHYAEVPSIKANLPNDFFYPFLYSRSSKHVSNLCIIFILLRCLVYTVLR